jgi:hypothetical protein
VFFIGKGSLFLGNFKTQLIYRKSYDKLEEEGKAIFE